VSLEVGKFLYRRRVSFPSGISECAGPPSALIVPFDADVVVYGDPELLLATKILLGRLDGSVANSEEGGCDGVNARWSYAAMPKIAWMNWRCATASPFATQRT
jgi:hypothetical protein